MAAHLPTIPKVVFAYIEPISLVGGWLGPIVDARWFVSNQLPSSTFQLPTSQYPLRPHEIILALQVSNCYLLLGLLGVFILNTTTELRVVRAYLWALWLGDIGHVAVTLWGMGWHGSVDVGNWNAVVWGNIGATVFLFTTRSLYFAGLFGADGPPRSVKGKKVKR